MSLVATPSARHVVQRNYHRVHGSAAHWQEDSDDEEEIRVQQLASRLRDAIRMEARKNRYPLRRYIEKLFKSELSGKAHNLDTRQFVSILKRLPGGNELTDAVGVGWILVGAG